MPSEFSFLSNIRSIWFCAVPRCVPVIGHRTPLPISVGEIFDYIVGRFTIMFPVDAIPDDLLHLTCNKFHSELLTKIDCCSCFSTSVSGTFPENCSLLSWHSFLSMSCVIWATKSGTQCWPTRMSFLFYSSYLWYSKQTVIHISVATIFVNWVKRGADGTYLFYFAYGSIIC